MKRALTVLALAMVFVAALPRPASACSCMVPDLASSVEEAAAVFIGTQVSQTSAGFDTILSLDVHTVFKGDLGSTVDLRTADNSAACGITFSTSTPSGVVAYADGQGGLSVNLCSSGWSAGEVEAFFDDGSIPPPDTTVGTTTPTVPPTTVPPTTSSTISSAPDAPPTTLAPTTTVAPTTAPTGDQSTTTTTIAAALGDGPRPNGGVTVARAAAVLAIAGAVIGVAAVTGRPRGQRA